MAVDTATNDPRDTLLTRRFGGGIIIEGGSVGAGRFDTTTPSLQGLLLTARSESGRIGVEMGAFNATVQDLLITTTMTSGFPNFLTRFPDSLSSNSSSSPSPVTPAGAYGGDTEWTGGLIAEYVVRLVLAVLMILVNGLVLYTLATTRSLRCAANLVIGSLAVTDLLVGLASPPGLLIELEIVEIPFLCKMGYASVMALSSVSINHLLFVSVDRYLLISKPLRYGRLVTKRRVLAFIIGCWVWAVTLSVPFSIGIILNPGWDGRCRAELMYPLWLVLVLSALHFFLPLLVMTYVHSAIFLVARRQQKAIQESFRSTTAATTSANAARARAIPEEDLKDSEGGGEECCGAEVGGCGGGVGGLSWRNRAKLRAARLLVLPCGYFYLSWGPWFLTILAAVATKTEVSPHGLERFVQTLAVLNSLGNPLLYAITQPVLGRAMVAKVKALGRRCLKAYKGAYLEREDDSLVPSRQADLSSTV